jgi:hypothetical protein
MAGAISECWAEEEEEGFFSLGEMLATEALFFEAVVRAVRFTNLPWLEGASYACVTWVVVLCATRTGT